MADGQALRRHWWVAALLSLVVPGLGQFYAGRIREAVVFLAVWVVLLVLFQTPLPMTFAGFAVVYVGLIAVRLAAFVHAVAIVWRGPTVERQAYHRWYGYAGYAAIVLGSLLILGFGVLSDVGGPPAWGGYHPFRVVNNSMEPTLRPGDYIMVDTSSSGSAGVREAVGHVVVYARDTPYMHRMVAAGGDRVALRNAQLIVNDRALPRKDLCVLQDPETGDAQLSIETNGKPQYVVQQLTAYDGAESPQREYEEVALEADQFFVVGDARDGSNDSRFSGALRDEQFTGRALYIFWSGDWARIGRSLAPDAPIVRADYCGSAP